MLTIKVQREFCVGGRWVDKGIVTCDWVDDNCLWVFAGADYVPLTRAQYNELIKKQAIELL